jgi:hypothetical protein
MDDASDANIKHLMDLTADYLNRADVQTSLDRLVSLL